MAGSAPFLIYGATGYTGRLVLERALAAGCRPILAGRDPWRLADLAERTGCAYQVATCEVAGALEPALEGVAVLLNAAGPFARTALPLAEACLRTGTHYVDLAGEIEVFRRLHALDGAARERGVMLMPGAAFVVAATDCLALHATRRVPDAHSLVLAVSRPTLWSRGSVETMIDQWTDGVEVRRDGVLREVPTGTLVRRFDYGDGCRFSTALRWPDVFTATLTTGIENVEVYGEVDAIDWWSIELRRTCAPLLDAIGWRRLFKLPARLLSEGPDAAVRAAHDRVVIAEVRDAEGRGVGSRVRTPDPYGFTQQVAFDVVRRVSSGDWRPGFQTPAGAYGPELILGPGGLVAEDVPLYPV